MTLPVRQLSALLLAGLLVVSAGASDLGDGAGDSCWGEGFDEYRCCVLKDSACWDAMFTEEVCCPSKDGRPASRRGNPECWMDGYNYETCCEANVTAAEEYGCWDSVHTPESCCEDIDVREFLRLLDPTKYEFHSVWLEVRKVAMKGELKCKEEPPGLWREVKRAAMMLNTSMIYGRRLTGSLLGDLDWIRSEVYKWVQDPHIFDLAKQNCLPGVLNAIDLVISSVEANNGTQLAREVYGLRLRIDETQVQWGTWHDIKVWRAQAPLLLGYSPLHSCHGTSLRIYIYRIQKLAHMTDRVLECGNKMPMCTLSVHLHRYLERGTCITDDPEQADLFFVPAYESCYNSTPCYDKELGSQTARCFPNSFDPDTDLAYFARRRGIDHIFSFGCNLFSVSDKLVQATRQSIIVTVESMQLDLTDKTPLTNWLSYWKDVLVPGFTPKHRILAMEAHSLRMHQRPVLLAFHGLWSQHVKGHLYAVSPMSEIRTRVIDYFWNMPDASVNGPVDDYFRRMGKSKFCLIPAGLTAWTVHLYEAFFFECIPVILSDEMTMPFQNFINWKELSIHLPESISMEELHNTLASFSIGRLQAMQQELKKAKCWFDYSRGWSEEDSGPNGCSPYRGMLAALEARVKQAKDLEAMPRYWMPPFRT